MDLLEERFQRACEDMAVKSTRRLLFTHCSESMEELGYYHADLVYSRGGTGILIKYKELFFVLTARHVLTANYEREQNENPFFVSLKSNGFRMAELDQVAFAIREWRIGELIAGDVPNIDFEDIVLVELGHPMRYPAQFLNLDDANEVARHSRPLSSEEKYLIVAGYPTNSNPIEYPYADVNCVATLHRHIMVGRYHAAEGLPVVNLLHARTHDELNGISGGSVATLANSESSSQWAGMVQRADAGVINFFPASLIIPAIVNYMESRMHEIDPAASLVDPYQANSQEAIEARSEYNLMLKNIEFNE